MYELTEFLKMKTNENNQLPATLFTSHALGMVSCEEKDSQAQFEIYENHEITACAVKDPLKNYTWLSEFIEENRRSRLIIL